MKNLEQLTNHERAKIIFGLFPTELNAFIDFVAAMAETINEEQQMQRKEWKNALFTFDTWLAQVNAVQQDIKELKNSPKPKPSAYLDLFEGTKAWFTVYCISLYTTSRQHPNTKFATAVGLFFDL